MSTYQFESFNVNNALLEGKNLVEASAGTGKTFSIGLLVLRLVLEKDIAIEKILMVTFTNNAVAELEERLRRFVKEAHDYAVYNKNAEQYISLVVENAFQISGKHSVVQRLKDALLFLDQLSVMTIHGFCQQTLSNQAFETGQLFGAELVTTMDDIYEHYVNEFWRKHINTLPLVVYKVLRQEAKFNTGSILGVIKNYFGGNEFFSYREGEHYRLPAAEFQQYFETAAQRQTQNRKSFERYLDKHREDIRKNMLANATARKYVDHLEVPGQMWDYIRGALKEDKKYISKVFDERLLSFFTTSGEIEAAALVHLNELLNNIYCFSLYKIVPAVNAHIQAAGMISFDGLIRNLHTAITGPNQMKIVRELQSKYQVVFVDEFQDTDKLQYEIFKTAFHTRTILFYIGDPKQSIYAFRQADINTYLAAYKDVDRLYSMNTNYRSTPGYVSALNEFFLPAPDFDTFLFNNQADTIHYTAVEAREQPVENEFFYGSKKQVPLRVLICKKNEDVIEGLAEKILELLNDKNYKIHQQIIKPSDIGILVADKLFGKSVKTALNKRNIPAVVLNDDRVMQSPEAGALYHVLRAMHNPTLENVNTGLLNQFTGRTTSEITSYKKEQLIWLFRGYKTRWESGGINVAISTWMKDFGVREYLTRSDTENGLRIISNLDQLKELLIKTQYLQHMNPDELLDWMKRAKDLELLDEDESVIRLENDADAVTIITIHRSKGLQYKIAFVPQADLKIKEAQKLGLVSLYQNGKYILVPGNQMDSGQVGAYELQARQEKRRLLYVALTRGIYAGFVYKNEQFKNKSTLTDFMAAAARSDLIAVSKFEPVENKDAHLRYLPENLRHAVPAVIRSGFELLHPNWRFMSYSALTPEHGYPSPQGREEPASDYDKFIFEKLRRGSITGTMLHEILEKIDFQNDENHIYPVQRAIERYASSNTGLYLQYLPRLIQHILQSQIHVADFSFQLKDIPGTKQLHELEFDFPVGSFDTQALRDLCRQYGIDISIVNRSELYGMMNGFIDMFFEHEGKYYVLDWKSNHLGNSISSYTGKALLEAMRENNYHLQYLIYALAIRKYLRQRLKSFDYEQHFGGVIYCFVRGMRSGAPTGVFFKKPEGALMDKLEDLLG